MKILILFLLLITGCINHSKLSTEKITDNANFVLSMLQIESKSLDCFKNNSTEMTCTSIDDENKKTKLNCNNEACYIISRED